VTLTLQIFFYTTSLCSLEETNNRLFLLHHFSYHEIDIIVSCCISDPKSTCEVITSPPIRRQNVTLSCSVTYRHLAEIRGSIPRPSLSRSVSWDSAAGTFLRRSSTAVYNSNGSRIIGGTLQVDVMKLANGAVIPSYNCTSSFHFRPYPWIDPDAARNTVRWSCVSAPVFTWCTYFNF